MIKFRPLTKAEIKARDAANVSKKSNGSHSTKRKPRKAKT